MKVYIICLLFIAADIASGLLKAVHDGTLDSAVMREGLFHKFGELLALAFSTLLEYTAQEGLGPAVGLPIVGVVAGYIMLMETISVLENLCRLNPAMGTLFEPYLAKLKEKGGEGDGDE